MTDEGARAELEQRCSEALRRVADLAKPQDSEWLTLDLGMGQFKAMVVLIKHKQLTVGGLARALDISEPSASLVVDKLVTRGLVERNTDVADRRRTLVVPTDEGNRLLERLRRTQQDQLSGWLGLVQERDLRALVQGLDALADAIEHERSQA
jgi:DNA-binding MarR family transcriptional regulator